MPTSYTEPKVYEPLRIEVIPPGQDAPVLYKERNIPEFKTIPQAETSSLVHRPASTLSQPLPSKQAAKFVGQSTSKADDVIDVEWKVVGSKQKTRFTNNNSNLDDQRARAAEEAEFLGNVLIGIYDEIKQTPYEARPYLANPYVADDGTFATYTLTRQAVESLRDRVLPEIEESLKTAKDFYQNIWDNLPDFKLPEFNLPKVELPKVELPKVNLPEINIPSFNFNPQPSVKTPTKDEIEQYKERERQRREDRKKNPDNQIKRIIRKLPDGCTATFTLARVGFLIGRRDRYGYARIERFNGWRPGYFEIKRLEQATDSLHARHWDVAYVEEAPERIPNTAFIRHILNEIQFTVSNKSDPQAPLTDDDGKPYFPVSAYTNELITSFNNFKLVKYTVNCHQPIPDDEIPPKPDKPMDCCDCRSIARIVKEVADSLKYQIEIPIIKCERNETTKEWEPKEERKTIEVFANSEQTATSLGQLYLEQAEQARRLCDAKNEIAVAAIPESWQVAIDGDRPQLVVLFAELIKTHDGKTKLGRSRYPISIPHYNKPPEFKPTIPNYKKGQYMGKLVLKDNSKLIVNAYSSSEAKRVIAQLVQYINPEMFQRDSKGNPIKKPRIIERGGDELKQIQVTPTNANFFSTGRKDMNPDWVKQFA